MEQPPEGGDAGRNAGICRLDSLRHTITNGNLALFREVADAQDMGPVRWLLLALVVLILLTSVRVHHWPGGQLGETWSLEFVPPWR